jgi:hypothetical protein
MNFTEKVKMGSDVGVKNVQDKIIQIENIGIVGIEKVIEKKIKGK